MGRGSSKAGKAGGGTTKQAAPRASRNNQRVSSSANITKYPGKGRTSVGMTQRVGDQFAKNFVKGLPAGAKVEIKDAPSGVNGTYTKSGSWDLKKDSNGALLTPEVYLFMSDGNMKRIK